MLSFDHPKMNDWRNNRKGTFNDNENNFYFYGAVDDVGKSLM